jgi:hypothetical protein
MTVSIVGKQKQFENQLYFATFVKNQADPMTPLLLTI